jgi:hypothetical protein
MPGYPWQRRERTYRIAGGLDHDHRGEVAEPETSAVAFGQNLDRKEAAIATEPDCLS